MKLDLSELIVLKTLLIFEIQRTEERSERCEYNKDNLNKYKSILQKINKQINKRSNKC